MSPTRLAPERARRFPLLEMGAVLDGAADEDSTAVVVPAVPLLVVIVVEVMPAEPLLVVIVVADVPLV
jgi:hypothetical protein